MLAYGPAGADTVGYSYDAVGNRLAEIRDSATEVYTYAADSHRLINVAGEARGLDANGNTTTIGSATLTYDARNRLTRHTRAGQIANYQYNGRGERVQKQAGGITRRFAYDEAGHLLGEYNTNGTARQEFLWLDDLPIGVVQSDGSVLIIQADHLQTPRALADAAGTMVWSWPLGGEAFGGDAAQSDPDGNGVAVEFGLRFPGQYFDAESGLHYNYFRDYEPTTGRYIESDPIGLGGGTNTFGYAMGMPTRAIDPLGLAVVLNPPPRPGIDRTPDGTVFCKGGTPTAYYNRNRLSDLENRCIGECVAAHEQSHVEDINRANPGICRYFGWLPYPHRLGYPTFDNDAERLRSEFVAYAEELRCLQSKLTRGSCQEGPCDEAIRRRMDDILDVLLPSVMDGTYGSQR